MIDLDPTRIVPDPSRTLREGAIAPWTTRQGTRRTSETGLVEAAPGMGLPLDVAVLRALDPGAGRIALRRRDSKSWLPGAQAVLPAAGVEGVQDARPGLPEPVAGLPPLPRLPRSAGSGPRRWRSRSAGWTWRASRGGRSATPGRSWPSSDRPIEAGNPVARHVLDQAPGRGSTRSKRIGLDYLTLDRQARTLSSGREPTPGAGFGTGVGAGQHALCARRALGRTASSRRRAPDRHDRRAPGRGELGGRGRARRGDPPGEPTGWSTSARGRATRAAGSSTKGLPRGWPESPDRPRATILSGREADRRAPEAGGPPRGGSCSGRRDREQPSR